MEHSFSLMIHGGAGALRDPSLYAESLRSVLAHGRELLTEGAPALDVVEICTTLLEDDPLFNAGRGSVLTALGNVEMDAAIMDGRTLRAGGVAGVSLVQNPIALARKVLEQGERVLLAGVGAGEYAATVGVARQPDVYFHTPEREQQLRVVRQRGGVALDHSATSDVKYGTVGAVARDLSGNLAAATSTGGLVNKTYGRVGDSPIVGAGLYADNESGAISCTGVGEDFLRTALAKEIEVALRNGTRTAQEAASYGIEYLVRKVHGLGAVIVIDRTGRCGFAHSTACLLGGFIEQGGELMILKR